MDTVSLQPEMILRRAGVHARSVVADFGCGPGVFALPATSLTAGTVYAIDVRQAMLDVCKNEAEHHSIGNLSTALANLELERGSGLSDGSVDLVIMRKILSQNKNKKALFREAYRVLKPGGTLVVIGWRDDAMTGLGSGTHMSRARAEELGDLEGFTNPEEILVNVHHYGLLFSKQ